MKSILCTALFIANMATVVPASRALAQRDTPPAVIQKIAGKDKFQSLNASDYLVQFFSFQEGRAPVITPISADGIWLTQEIYYIRESKTGKWYTGHANSTNPKTIECQNIFANDTELSKAAAYQPLPVPPKGFRIREVTKLTDFPVRMAVNQNHFYILMVDGDIWKTDLATGKRERVLKGDEYLRGDGLTRTCQGLLIDKQNRLYISSNERISGPTVMNEVHIWRAQTHPDTGAIDKPISWLKTEYPWGIGAFNHGVSKLAFGPDGMLYVGSGSRTGAGEKGGIAHYSEEGETPLTANIWRLDPKSDNPMIEVYASGIRNPFSFCWNEKREFFAVDHGPDADAPEELNLILKGHHYGFPFQFSDWTKKPYPHTPDIPTGLKIDLPIQNYGPDAGGSE